MPHHKRHAPGTAIALREHWRGKIWTVRPVTVIDETPALLALYMRPGTTHKQPCAADGSPVPHFLPDEWILSDRVWQGGGALYLAAPGKWFVIMGFFSDDNERIERWYANLQTPYHRSRIGYDYLDQELDILISGDLRTWEWKDEEKFLDAQRRGRISAEQASRVRRVGEEVVRELEAGRLEWLEAWRHWKAPSHWNVPGIPEGWEIVEV